jgi:hypothetical protein
MRRPEILVLGVVALPSCGTADGGPAGLEAVIEWITEANPGSPPHCGNDTSPHSRFMIVTTDHAYSCRSLGYALRRAQQGTGSERVVLLVPSRDVQDVCAFLQRELVLTAVYSLPVRFSYWAQSLDSPVVLFKGADGWSDRVFSRDSVLLPLPPGRDSSTVSEKGW